MGTTGTGATRTAVNHYDNEPAFLADHRAHFPPVRHSFTRPAEHGGEHGTEHGVSDASSSGSIEPWS